MSSAEVVQYKRGSEMPSGLLRARRKNPLVFEGCMPSLRIACRHSEKCEPVPFGGKDAYDVLVKLGILFVPKETAFAHKGAAGGEHVVGHDAIEQDDIARECGITRRWASLLWVRG